MHTFQSFCVTVGLKGSQHAAIVTEMKDEDEEQGASKENPEEPDPNKKLNLAEVIDPTATSIPNGTE